MRILSLHYSVVVLMLVQEKVITLERGDSESQKHHFLDSWKKMRRPMLLLYQRNKIKKLLQIRLSIKKSLQCHWKLKRSTSANHLFSLYAYVVWLSLTKQPQEILLPPFSQFLVGFGCLFIFFKNWMEFWSMDWETGGCYYYNLCNCD